MVITRTVLLAAAAALVAACGAPASVIDESTSTPAPTAASPATATEPGATYVALPDGWRWESFLGVVVGVPDHFGWTSTDQRLTQWCVDGAEPLRPAVGRPGVATQAYCGPDVDGTDIDVTGPLVAFDVDIDADPLRSPAASEDRRRGDRVTRDLGAVQVLVQVEPPLRDRVLATVAVVGDGEQDPYGCPVDDPVSLDPAARPAPGGMLSPGQVETVAVCTYAVVPPEEEYDGPTLTASRRLIGREASVGIAALASAPDGGGPDSPRTCTARASYGEEITVLRVASRTAPPSRVVLRYSGCDHHGIDDGATLRTLTREALAPFLRGANRPTSWSGVVDDVLSGLPDR